MLARTLVSLALAAAFWPVSHSCAQEGSGESEGEAPPGSIIVTGEGLPDTPAAGAYTTEELTREVLLTVPSGRLENALGSVPGFQQFRRSDSRSANPSAQGVTLRALGGNATSRALVLLDGVPMADPFFGYLPFGAIAPEALSSVQVTRGGGTGPFGAGALTGTIALQSVTAGDLAPLSASLLANDRAETEASMALSQRLGTGNVVAHGRWDRGQGFYTTPLDQRVPATARAAFDSWSAGLRAAIPVGDTAELQARTLIYRDKRTLRFEGADSSSEGQDVSLRLVGRGRWQFDMLGYVQARDFSNVVISSTRFVRVLDQRATPSTGIGGKFELRPPVGDAQTLRLGADYRRTDGELQEEAYSAFTAALRERRRAGGTNSNLGLYAEHDRTLGALLVTGGLRADRTVIANGFYRARDAAGGLVQEISAPDRSEWSLSWRGAARYEPSDAIVLRGAAYTGLRLPTLNELYRPFVVFPVVTEANAALENERLKGAELGLDLAPQGSDFTLSLTVFDNRIDNAIANVTLEPELRQRRNLPAIKARGIEASLSARRGNLALDASLAASDAEVKGEGASLALDGKRPPQVPRFSGTLRLSWAGPKGSSLVAQLRHVGAQFEDDLESDRLPPATTASLFGHWPLAGKVDLVVRAENIFNERIVTRNAAGALDLGAPRTIWAGLRYGM